MIKDGQDSDRPHAHEARGLDCKKPNPERKRKDTSRFENIPKKERTKRPRRSQNTPPRPRGLHPAGALARPHRKKLRRYDSNS
jgi:hypothetical protein